MPEELRDCKDIVLEAVKVRTKNFKYASDRIKYSKAIVKEIIENDGMC